MIDSYAIPYIYPKLSIHWQSVFSLYQFTFTSILHPVICEKGKQTKLQINVVVVMVGGLP